MNIKQYKKRYLICKDDFGKNIYAGDTVELYCPIECIRLGNLLFIGVCYMALGLIHIQHI